MTDVMLTVAFVIFGWALLGLINPTVARLPNRAASVPFWFVSVVLLGWGVALLPGEDGDDQREARYLPRDDSSSSRPRYNVKGWIPADPTAPRTPTSPPDPDDPELQAAAAVQCPDRIERLARFSHRWTDGFLGAKFTHHRLTRDPEVVTYLGDSLEFQNGFGAWQPHRYECDLNARTLQVVAVRAEPGRMAP